jgi:hypothetical protein
MTTQVKHWLQAAGVVAGLTLLLSFPALYAQWQVADSMQGAVPSFAGTAWGPLEEQAMTTGGEISGVLALLALTQAISHYLLQDRFRILTGTLLLVAASAVASWFLFQGSTEGDLALGFGLSSLLGVVGVPMAAGAWMLRTRGPAPVPKRAAAAFAGGWESGLGLLTLDPDAAFTLLRDQGEPVSGVWELRLGRAPGIVLTTVAPTEFGEGRQATVLPVEHGADGRPRLRVDRGTAFTRVEAEPRDGLALEAAHGFVGQVEILES